MSQVQLKVKPRRTRCNPACEPPPFRFDAVLGPRSRAHVSRGAAVVRIPGRIIGFLFAVVGKLIDAAFFIVGIAIWCSLHMVLWSYAFDAGPAADCFGLPCPPWVTSRVLLGCAALAAVTFTLAIILRRLGHRATANVLVLLVTFDVAALMILGANQLF
ncbi:MAG: hypothetical protein JWM25_1507 [Thermoleophilia bacterium]|nr:hypothetical protein [Thermoleophilia bacterium]MCZ4496922.1 hypothetical protein [Thermoleophilia bacterium]